MEQPQYPCHIHEAQLEQAIKDIADIKEDIHGNHGEGIRVRLAIVEEHVVKDLPQIQASLSTVKRLLYIGIGVLCILEPLAMMFLAHVLQSSQPATSPIMPSIKEMLTPQ